MVDRKAFRRFQPEAALPSDTQSKDVQPTYGAAIANGECLIFTILQDLTIKCPFSHADVLITDNLSPAGSAKKPHLSDEDLLLTPTMVYGFSLSDKLWRELRSILNNPRR